MENLLYNFSQVLGITVIHSLWQGLLIWLVLRILFLSAPSLSSAKKHNLSFLALLSITAWFAFTFYTEAQVLRWNQEPVNAAGINIQAHTSVIISLPIPAQTVNNAPDNYQNIIYSTLKGYLPYISVLYAIGLIINLLNLLVAWNKIRIIKKSLLAAAGLQEYILSYCRQLEIRKYIQVNITPLVDVPCVIGYFKPILLLPATLSTRLTPEEIEAILLHELIHIKNNDYILNILQQMATVVLFFNPFVLFINQLISTERENKCDDIVVRTTSNPLIYAHALLKLEEDRQTDLKLALAATGKKYTLLSRIERIMKANKPIVNIRHLVLIILLFAGSLASISWLKPDVKIAGVRKKFAKAVHNMAGVIKAEKKMALPVHVVKLDTPSLDSVSAIRDLKQHYGKKPLVIIDGKEYDSDILYKISTDKSHASYRGMGPEAAVKKYGEKAKDGAVEMTTRTGQIFYMDDTERQNILKEEAVAKDQFITRLILKNSDGSLFDRVILRNTSGGSASDDVTHNGKIAFLVDGKVYSEEEFNSLDQSKLDELKNSKSRGVGHADGLDIPGVDLSGYESLFFFSREMPPLKKPVRKSETMTNPDGIRTGMIPKDQLEMMKKIGGITIDETTGKITARGEPVNRIRINGKEYPEQSSPNNPPDNNPSSEPGKVITAPPK